MAAPVELQDHGHETFIPRPRRKGKRDMSTGMRKWMEKDCPEIEYLSAEVSIGREELRQLRDELVQYKNERDDLRARIAEMEKQEPVGTTGGMPGTTGFTMACFHADKVPIGTKLYALPGAKGEDK